MARRLQSVFVAFVTAVALFAGTSAAPVDSSPQTYIVVLQAGTPDVASVASEMARAHGGQVGFVYEHALQGFSVTISARGAAALARNPLVAYVNEDRPVRMSAETTPTGVSRIDAPAAHSTGATGAGIRVAIIDTGIDSDHPDLQGNLDMSSGWDCIGNDNWAEDDQGHGTHVAGTVAAVGGNGIGVVGVAPGATVVPVKVLDSSGNGTWATVTCGIDHVAALNSDVPTDNDIHVANMSLGGAGTHDGTTCEQPGPDTMYQAICSAIGSGATFVVAAGNDSQDASGFTPAAYPEVITVSAFSDTDGTTAKGKCSGPFFMRTCDEVFAPFSNYGEIVDVIAPGVDIQSTTNNGSYGTKSGTSMASPHVAGVAALILQQNPGLSPTGVSDHLRANGQCPDNMVNAGTGDCSTEKKWEGDPDLSIEPMSNADYATTTTDTATNTPPTASFTFTCTDLSCTFDGTGSSDTDGTITHAWDFGDTSTGSGVTASHTYAADGTYTVTLTVTDDAGATDTSSQSVTVTAPATGGITLGVNAYKDKGTQTADLTWSGAAANDVDVYRNGGLVQTTANDGAYTDSTGQKGGGAATYKVCEAGTSTCSNEVTANW